MAPRLTFLRLSRQTLRVAQSGGVQPKLDRSNQVNTAGLPEHRRSLQIIEP